MDVTFSAKTSNKNAIPKGMKEFICDVFSAVDFPDDSYEVVVTKWHIGRSFRKGTVTSVRLQNNGLTFVAQPPEGNNRTCRDMFLIIPNGQDPENLKKRLESYDPDDISTPTTNKEQGIDLSTINKIPGLADMVVEQMAKITGTVINQQMVENIIQTESGVKLTTVCKKRLFNELVKTGKITKSNGNYVVSVMKQATEEPERSPLQTDTEETLTPIKAVVTKGRTLALELKVFLVYAFLPVCVSFKLITGLPETLFKKMQYKDRNTLFGSIHAALKKWDMIQKPNHKGKYLWKTNNKRVVIMEERLRKCQQLANDFQSDKTDDHYQAFLLLNNGTIKPDPKLFPEISRARVVETALEMQDEFIFFERLEKCGIISYVGKNSKTTRESVWEIHEEEYLACRPLIEYFMEGGISQKEYKIPEPPTEPVSIPDFDLITPVQRLTENCGRDLTILKQLFDYFHFVPFSIQEAEPIGGIGEAVRNLLYRERQRWKKGNGIVKTISEPLAEVLIIQFDSEMVPLNWIEEPVKVETKPQQETKKMEKETSESIASLALNVFMKFQNRLGDIPASKTTRRMQDLLEDLLVVSKELDAQISAGQIVQRMLQEIGDRDDLKEAVFQQLAEIMTTPPTETK